MRRPDAQPRAEFDTIDLGRVRNAITEKDRIEQIPVPDVPVIDVTILPAANWPRWALVNAVLRST